MYAARYRTPVLFWAALLFILPAPAPTQTVDTAQAIQGLAEFEDVCRRAEALWPTELCGPLILVHPGTRLAVANRSDPDGRFQSHDGVFVGEWPADMGVAYTALDWGGTRWAMVMLPLPEDTFSRLQLLIHESFHRIQPELGLEISKPMLAHLDEEEGRVWLRLEIRALARALASEGAEARVAAPEVLEPGPDGTVNGPGWILELEPGWRLVPGPRPGDLRLEPDPGA